MRIRIQIALALMLVAIYQTPLWTAPRVPDNNASKMAQDGSSNNLGPQPDAPLVPKIENPCFVMAKTAFFAASFIYGCGLLAQLAIRGLRFEQLDYLEAYEQEMMLKQIDEQIKTTKKKAPKGKKQLKSI